MHGVIYLPALPSLQRAGMAGSAAMLRRLEPSVAHEVAQPAYWLTVGRGSNPLAALSIMPGQAVKQLPAQPREVPALEGQGCSC